VRTVFALSPPTLVVRNVFLPGTGFLRARHLSRRHALQRAAGQAPIRYVRPMSASQTLDYEYPYSLAPGTVHETCASCDAMGFGTHHVTGGGDAHAASVSPLERVALAPASRLATVPGILSADAADATNPCHPCRVSHSGFSRTFLRHAFAWVLPGESCQDRFYRCRVNSNGFPDRGQLSSIGAFSLRQGLRPI
jgi:hypothetical protein